MEHHFDVKDHCFLSFSFLFCLEKNKTKHFAHAFREKSLKKKKIIENWQRPLSAASIKYFIINNNGS